MRETIKGLRNIILKKMAGHSTCGFSTENISEREFAKNPSTADVTWESYLYKRGNIRIILSFNKGRHGANALPVIKIHENEFEAVRLFLYDSDDISNFNIKITREALFNTLGDRLPPGKSVYKIEKSDRIFGHVPGHVLDLSIWNTGEVWNIGAHLPPDQLEKASADLVEKVVTTLDNLLPVAKHYADNRKAILSGQI